MEPKVKRIKLSELKFLQNNPNKGSERGHYLLEQSLEQGGAGRSILLSNDNTILTGNQTTDVYGQMMPNDEVIVIETDGKTLVAVKRTDIPDANDKRAKTLIIADNKTSDHHEYDAQVIADLLASDEDVVKKFFFQDELDTLLAELATEEPAADPGAQMDRAGELQEKWQVARGDVYEIASKSLPGKCHRVMCGDSTSAEDVARLMGGVKADAVIADPPYGMNLDTDYSSMPAFEGRTKPNKHDAVIGDNADFDPSPIFDFFNTKEMFLWGADYYSDFIPNKKIGSWFVWDKRDDGNLDDMFGSAFELCWSKVKHKREIIRVKWAGVFGTETQDVKNRIHPTQKPIEVITWLIERFCNGVIIDPFLGSGTTLVACEQTGRVGYGMELHPPYVAVSLQRLADMGLEVRKITGISAS